MIPCYKCGVPQPIENYPKRKDLKSGHGGVCKSCRYLYQAEWQRKNAKRVNAYHQAYYTANPDKVQAYKERSRATRLDWYQRNRERLREANRQYHKANRERIQARKREWWKRNPTVGRNLQRKRKTRKRAAGLLGGHHTEQEWVQLLDSYDFRCAYCWAVAPLTRDHLVPLSRGGSDLIANIVPACVSCNCEKWTKTADEFLGNTDSGPDRG